MGRVVLEGHEAGVVYAVFSNDDASKIVSGDRIGNVFVWRDNGDGEWERKASMEGAYSPEVNPNNPNEIVAVHIKDNNHYVKVWNLTDDNKWVEKASLGMFRRPEHVFLAKFSGDGKKIGLLFLWKGFQVWEREGESTWVEKGKRFKSDKINYVEFNPMNSDEIVVALSDGSSEVRNLEDAEWKPISTLRGLELTNEEKKELVDKRNSETDDNWFLGLPIDNKSFGEKMLYRAHFSKDGKKIVTTNANRTVSVWRRKDLESNEWELEGTLKPSIYDRGTNDARFNSDGDEIVLAMYNQNVNLWEWDEVNWKRKKTFSRGINKGETISTAVFNNATTKIVAGYANSKIIVWDTDSFSFSSCWGGGSSGKSARRRSSRRKASRRKASRRKASRRKASRRKASRRKAARRKASRRRSKKKSRSIFNNQ
jgi:WD40 repeat protein